MGVINHNFKQRERRNEGGRKEIAGADKQNASKKEKRKRERRIDRKNSQGKFRGEKTHTPRHTPFLTQLITGKHCFQSVKRERREKGRKNQEAKISSEN